MELYTAIVVTIAPIILGIVGNLFIKNYLPSYFDKKAENLATKEDIGVITGEVEEVKHIYQTRYDLTKVERDFYNEMIKVIYDLLAVVKKYEFDNGQQLRKEAALKDPKIKEEFFRFVDSANEILGRAFVFLPEKNYVLLRDAIGEKGSINAMAKNLLFAMRKSIHSSTGLNKETDIKEINY